MSVDTLPYASLLGLARVLDDWLRERGLTDSDDDEPVTVKAADADALLHRLAADGFLLTEPPR